MVSTTTAKFRSGSAIALVGVAMVVAGCGSSSSSSGSPAANAPPASSASQAAATGVSIGTAKGSDGTYLAGASGRALYLWVADSGGKSSCSGACAKVWPPLLTKGTPIASRGVVSSDLGTVTRADGTKQVTYKGHPLYSFAEDSGSGMTKGQGSDTFGAKWWLVAPSGSAITGGASSAASSGGSGNAAASSSSSSSAGGGWG